MSILQSRKPGTPTVAMTVRIDAEAHKRLRQYALRMEKSMTLSLDEMIFKATEDIFPYEKNGGADEGGEQ